MTNTLYDEHVLRPMTLLNDVYHRVESYPPTTLFFRNKLPLQEIKWKKEGEKGIKELVATNLIVEFMRQNSLLTSVRRAPKGKQGNRQSGKGQLQNSQNQKP